MYEPRKKSSPWLILGVLAFAIFWHLPTNLLQTKIYDNIFFSTADTDEFVNGPQHVVPIFDMLDDYDEPITDPNPLEWFRANVVDHCPIYAVFRADKDTD